MLWKSMVLIHCLDTNISIQNYSSFFILFVCVQQKKLKPFRNKWRLSKWQNFHSGSELNLLTDLKKKKKSIIILNKTSIKGQ